MGQMTIMTIAIILSNYSDYIIRKLLFLLILDQFPSCPNGLKSAVTCFCYDHASLNAWPAGALMFYWQLQFWAACTFLEWNQEPTEAPPLFTGVDVLGTRRAASARCTSLQQTTEGEPRTD